MTGTYTVTCNVSDAAGNPADTFTRTITIAEINKTPLQNAIDAANDAISQPNVIDDTKKQDLQNKIDEATAAMNNPNLTEAQRDTLISALQTAIDALNHDLDSPVFSGATTKTFTVGSSDALNFDPISGITANDAVDGSITPTCTVTPSYNPSAVGTYRVECSATDTANNTSQFTRIITITEINKVPLQDKIAAANAALADPKVMDDTHKQNLQDKINEATTALSNPNLTEAQRDTLIGELQSAIDALVRDTTPPVFDPSNPAPIVMRKGMDITALVNAVTATDALSGLNAQGVTNNANTIALDTANPTPGNYTLTYTATDNKNNTSTVNRSIQITDADALIAKIAHANNPATTQGKTPESIARLQAKVAAGQAIVNNNNATQAAIDQALAEIQDAINALQNISNPTPSTPVA